MADSYQKLLKIGHTAVRTDRNVSFSLWKGCGVTTIDDIAEADTLGNVMCDCLTLINQITMTDVAKIK